MCENCCQECNQRGPVEEITDECLKLHKLYEILTKNADYKLAFQHEAATVSTWFAIRLQILSGVIEKELKENTK